MTRLWDRGEPLDEVIARFTVGNDPTLDQLLVPYDALGSAAHATMLARIGVLDGAEAYRLCEELGRIAALARAGRFEIRLEDEDGHTAIENHLTARLGDAGRRIHTGRSRNDQVIAALRLFGREAVLEVCEQLLGVCTRLLALAEAHQAVSVAGYTHTRQAMPSTLGHLFWAHAEGILDGMPWLETAYRHLNRSPLGSASGYGVGLALDREHVAELLGFDRVQENTLAVQNDRGKTEFAVLGAVALPLLDLGRLATDLIWYSTEEFGYLTLGDAVTTGSSIMPQKRNPDVLELVRAAAQRLRSRQAEVATIYSSLISGYHRDLQLTKEPFMLGLGLAVDASRAMQRVLDTLTVNGARCRDLVSRASGATDVVYAKVAQGTPFRTAYKAVAADPTHEVPANACDLWQGRTHTGAPGAFQLGRCQAALGTASAWVAACRESNARAWKLLPSG